MKTAIEQLEHARECAAQTAKEYVGYIAKYQQSIKDSQVYLEKALTVVEDMNLAIAALSK